MIDVKDLSVSYPGVQALDQVTLSIQDGDWVLITGNSGCGKSTLARVLTGLLPHSIPGEVKGTVSVAGKDPRQHSVAEMSQHIGMVFQNPSSQLFHLKVVDEIAFGLRNIGLEETEINERVNWVLEATNLGELADSVPANLSGGQKQIVAIASVLAMQPKVIVLDEPTASLDDENVQRIMSTLVELREKLGVTIVMIEHRLTSAVKHADRLLILDEGRVVKDTSIQQLCRQPDLVKRLGLRRFSQEDPTSWKRLIRANGKYSTEEPLLSFKEVGAGYQGNEVIHDVNLNIYPGDFTALVGPNGAGKSTVALAAAGLLKPNRGKVIFWGGRRVRPGLDVNLLFQNPIDQLFTESVDEEISFGPSNYGCFDLEQHRITLEQADLVDLRTRSPLTLSVGQQHRTALGACVALRPKLVILDEPTLGQDWGHLQQLMNFLRRLSQQGTAILLISHDYKLVYRYANRVILMESGRIKMDGSLAQRESTRTEKEY
jgi:energy-coupling factor transport system ATP-binding protein